MKPTCSISDCTKTARARGWCTAHWTRWKRHGDPLGGGEDRPKGPPTCTIKGCDREHAARGLCSTHHDRLRKHGDPLADTPIAPSVKHGPACGVDGCDAPHRTLGYCKKHAQRLLRNGDPLALQKSQHGLHDHPLYLAWWSMLDRCNNPRNKSFHRYGGRGITVCERWQGNPEGLIAFIGDMGERPPDPPGWNSRVSYWSIDRIDNDGPYAPDNCRWATAKEQMSNRANSRRRTA